jgi:hypothetical protein
MGSTPKGAERTRRVSSNPSPRTLTTVGSIWKANWMGNPRTLKSGQTDPLDSRFTLHGGGEPDVAPIDGLS